MPRIRTIKPGFFTNEGLSNVSEAAQLLAGGLLCYADDEGYFNAHPGLVKAAIFPLREPSETVPHMLKALAAIGYLRFGIGKDGRRYGYIVNFSEHQKVSHAMPSKIKDLIASWEIPESSGEIPEDSRSLRPELNRTELNGSERKRTKKPSPQKPAEVLPVDSWHVRIRSMVRSAWSEQNGGAECPWGVADAAQLKLMRSKSPQWLDGQYAQCLANMYASAGFPRSKLPFEFLPKLCSYLSGPRNEFNREQGHESGNSKGDRRAADISKTTREIFGGSGIVSGNTPVGLQVKAAAAGAGSLAGHAERLQLSGVQSGNDAPDKQSPEI